MGTCIRTRLTRAAGPGLGTGNFVLWAPGCLGLLVGFPTVLSLHVLAALSADRQKTKQQRHIAPSPGPCCPHVDKLYVTGPSCTAALWSPRLEGNEGTTSHRVGRPVACVCGDGCTTSEASRVGCSHMQDSVLSTPLIA
ncbi:hypothetical protein V8F06_006957 [Rhypophila decipiens]